METKKKSDAIKKQLSQNSKNKVEKLENILEQVQVSKERKEHRTYFMRRYILQKDIRKLKKQHLYVSERTTVTGLPFFVVYW